MTEPYRDGDVKDVEYKTPLEPWHPSTAWFIASGCAFVAAFVGFNVNALASEHHPIVAANGLAIGVIASIATAVTGFAAGVQRWG